MTTVNTYKCEIELSALCLAIRETSSSIRRSRLCRKAQAIRRQLRGV